MPKFNLTIPHNYSVEEAKSRLERFAESMQAKFQDQVSDLDQSWNENTLNFGFKTFGIKIAGEMTVEEEALKVTGDLPFAAAMFKGKIESEMKEQLGRIMS